MDTPEPYTYHQAIQSAQDRYERDGNEKAYLATRLYLSLQRIADGYGNPQARMVLALGQHVIKGTVETLIGRLFDPHHSETAREDVVHEMLHHTKQEFIRDLEPLRAYLAHHLRIRL